MWQARKTSSLQLWANLFLGGSVQSLVTDVTYASCSLKWLPDLDQFMHNSKFLCPVDPSANSVGGKILQYVAISILRSQQNRCEPFALNFWAWGIIITPPVTEMLFVFILWTHTIMIKVTIWPIFPIKKTTVIIIFSADITLPLECIYLFFIFISWFIFQEYFLFLVVMTWSLYPTLLALGLKIFILTI